MLRSRLQYTAPELRALLGGYAAHTQEGNAFFIRPARSAPPAQENAALLLWDCGCRAVCVGAGGDATSYYALAACPRHASLPPSGSMPARLLADMFAMSERERAALLATGDPDIAHLFDAAVANVDPNALSSVVRDPALAPGAATVLEELLTGGAAAALERLRAAYDRIPPALRVSYRWNDLSSPPDA
jgi:hypothetical protein